MPPPIPSMPYAPKSLYTPRYADSIAQLLARQGDIAAAGAARSGEIWGQTVGNLGQIAGQAVQGYAAQKEQEKAKKTMEQRQEMFGAALETWDGKDPMSLYRKMAVVVGPEDALKVTSGLVGLQNLGKKPDAPDLKDFQATVGGLYATKKALGEEYLAKNWATIAPTLAPGVKAFLGVELPQEYTPEIGKNIDALNDQWNPAKSEKAAAVGSFEDFVVQKFGPRPTAEQIAQARKTYHEAGTTINMSGMDALYAAADPKAIAAGIMRGDIPPDISALGRPIGAAVASELSKKGYGLAAARSDWNATQKHLATLNGAQQTRLRQAVDTATHSLDVIEDLAKQWQGGRFPLLNKGQLAAAKGGALGMKAQQIATQLEAQITDVTSELGNVYMGGNSPTDHALQLAGKNLSADWSLPQLQSALELARKNLKIRSNAMVNVGVAGASADNPYAGPAAGAPSAEGGWTELPGGIRIREKK